jgi:hypothetical protein
LASPWPMLLSTRKRMHKELVSFELLLCEDH